MEHNQPDKELVSAHNLTEKPSIELETVEKAMRGDKEAFSALFMQTYRSMYLVVRRFLERDEDIYDALQNGYIKAYKYLSRLQAPEAFVSWLKKTMENAARDIRAAVTGPETAQEDMAAFADELTAEELTASERRADIREVLSRLDSRQAEVLTLYYYDGMKLSEIAKLLGEPPSTVRSRFAQAKKSLVEQLKVKGIDKSLYSGSVSAMIAVSLRSLIGTDVLSAATAQQMLDDILGGRQGRLGAAAYKMSGGTAQPGDPPGGVPAHGADRRRLLRDGGAAERIPVEMAFQPARRRAVGWAGGSAAALRRSRMESPAGFQR